MSDDFTFDASALSLEKFNLRIHAADDVTGVRVVINNAKPRVEHLLPFSVFSDTDADSRGIRVKAGIYKISIQALKKHKRYGKAFVRTITIK